MHPREKAAISYSRIQTAGGAAPLLILEQSCWWLQDCCRSAERGHSASLTKSCKSAASGGSFPAPHSTAIWWKRWALLLCRPQRIQCLKETSSSYIFFGLFFVPIFNRHSFNLGRVYVQLSGINGDKSIILLVRNSDLRACRKHTVYVCAR